MVMLIRKLNEGTMSGQKASEAERNSKCKGPGAAVSPAVSQGKVSFFWGDSPCLGPECGRQITGCLSDLPAPAARLWCRGQLVHSHTEPLLVAHAFRGTAGWLVQRMRERIE